MVARESTENITDYPPIQKPLLQNVFLKNTGDRTANVAPKQRDNADDVEKIKAFCRDNDIDKTAVIRQLLQEEFDEKIFAPENVPIPENLILWKDRKNHKHTSKMKALEFLEDQWGEAMRNGIHRDKLSEKDINLVRAIVSHCRSKGIDCDDVLPKKRYAINANAFSFIEDIMTRRIVDKIYLTICNYHKNEYRKNIPSQ